MDTVALVPPPSLVPVSSHGVSAHKPRGPATPAGFGVLPPTAQARGTSAEVSCKFHPLHHSWKFVSANRRRASTKVRASLIADELDVVPVTSNDPMDQQQGECVLMGMESVEDPSPLSSTLGGFSPEPSFTFDISSVAAGGASDEMQVLVASATDMTPSTDEQHFLDRAINAGIVGVAGALAITKIVTVDQDYWHGWTVYEILRYAPLHNWSAYEEALKANPVLAKMIISGIVYAIGDWIAQCYEGRPILDISRKRMIRSGLVGFCLHGSLSHFYYHICEALFPFKDWWGVPIKVAFDQTVWSAFWNSVYFVTLGVLRLESPTSIASELKATFWPMLTAGWKLWPFAHVITYGVIPVEQRLLWVDCVELIWVTILSMYSNEKAEARIQEGSPEALSAAELSTGASRDENM